MYAEDVKSNQLNRVLGNGELTALGIGAVIGGGIFVLTGVAHICMQARHWHFRLYWQELVVCLLFSYSEFASILPVEGSAYAYSYGTVGEFLPGLSDGISSSNI